MRGYYAFCSPLWHLFVPHFLDENVRQLHDHVFAQLLNRARIGQLSLHDIELLKERLYLPDNNNKNIIRMFPKIKQVKEFNAQIQNQLDQNSIVIHSKHIFSDFDSNAGSIAPDRFIPTDDRDAGGLPNILCVSRNSRVMLLRNIMTSQGLVNGATGVVEQIVYESDEVTEILVKFDNSTVGRVLQRTESNNAVPITRYSQSYRYRGRSVVRIQFPVTLSWACTIHKVQGLSLDEGVLSLGEDLFARGQGYVALSRIRTLNGVYLEAFCPSKIKPSDAVLKEYERLRSL